MGTQGTLLKLQKNSQNQDQTFLKGVVFSILLHFGLGQIAYWITKNDAARNHRSSRYIEVAWTTAVLHSSQNSSSSANKERKRIPPHLALNSSKMDSKVSRDTLNSAPPVKARSEISQAGPPVSRSSLVGNPGATGTSRVGANDFLGDLRLAIENKMEYPALARARHQRGRVRVGFTLRKNGEIVNIHLVESSNQDRLDLAALESVKTLGQFKPIPDELAKADWNIIVPLDFRLID